MCTFWYHSSHLFSLQITTYNEWHRQRVRVRGQRGLHFLARETIFLAQGQAQVKILEES